MTSYFRDFIFLLFFWGLSDRSMAASEQFGVSRYLREAKECFSNEHSKSSDHRVLPRGLRLYLNQLEDGDYLDHRFLSSGELLINFRKSRDDLSFMIELEFDLNKENGCERISVHEILS